ncbi:hypothetical protein JW905_18095 [bacterium]|nr:hypothetical protein [candidate division CSSED10-310 bacterium]
MSFHEIQMKSGRDRNQNRVYIIPRSKDPTDVAIITTMDEEELLRRGIKGEIVFHSFEPSRAEMETRVKEFLKARFRQVLKDNRDHYRKLKLALLIPPVLALLFIFSGFFDDILIDLAVVAFFLFLHRAELRERSNINRIEASIQALTVQENPLLTAIYASFQELDGDAFELPDLDTIKEQMPDSDIADTLEAIGSFLHMGRIRTLQRQLAQLDTAYSYANGVRRMGLYLLRTVRTWQLRAEQKRIRTSIGFRPGFRDVYEILLEDGRQEYVSLMRRSTGDGPER